MRRKRGRPPLTSYYPTLGPKREAALRAALYHLTPVTGHPDSPWAVTRRFRAVTRELVTRTLTAEAPTLRWLELRELVCRATVDGRTVITATPRGRGLIKAIDRDQAGQRTTASVRPTPL